MTVKQALTELINKGAEIEQINENQFVVYNNGFLGLIDDVNMFAVDGDDILEMYEQYCQ